MKTIPLVLAATLSLFSSLESQASDPAFSCSGFCTYQICEIREETSFFGNRKNVEHCTKYGANESGGASYEQLPFIPVDADGATPAIAINSMREACRRDAGNQLRNSGQSIKDVVVYSTNPTRKVAGAYGLVVEYERIASGTNSCQRL